jgi:hypothetical protein
MRCHPDYVAVGILTMLVVWIAAALTKGKFKL